MLLLFTLYICSVPAYPVHPYLPDCKVQVFSDIFTLIVLITRCAYMYEQIKKRLWFNQFQIDIWKSINFWNDFQDKHLTFILCTHFFIRSMTITIFFARVPSIRSTFRKWNIFNRTLAQKRMKIIITKANNVGEKTHTHPMAFVHVYASFQLVSAQGAQRLATNAEY